MKTKAWIFLFVLTGALTLLVILDDSEGGKEWFMKTCHSYNTHQDCEAVWHNSHEEK